MANGFNDSDKSERLDRPPHQVRVGIIPFWLRRQRRGLCFFHFTRRYMTSKDYLKISNIALPKFPLRKQIRARTIFSRFEIWEILRLPLPYFWIM